MTKSLVVHGHFYQPPRENPWTDSIEREPGAHPFHDWNERVHFECYRPNAFARILDERGRVARIVNNYAHVSFNFGPTLLSWLEREQPLTYGRILEADRESLRARSGHGNALAQSYHHSILPLCNRRDQLTEIRWGTTDFRRRFNREPESLWLPETACSDDMLDALTDEGLRFVVLSPYQAARVRPLGADGWQDVSGGAVNPSVAYRRAHSDGSGRSIAVFFYDGHVSRAIAFDGLLSSSHMLVYRLTQAAAGGPLASVATDGESYGHHYKFGDRCLAYALEELAAGHGLRVTNFAEFLSENPPEWEVELSAGPDGEGTAWSCAHGLGRWSRDCGCHAGAPDGWTQSWRAPLRAALDFLRDHAAARFEDACAGLLPEPWDARDAYAEILTDRNAPRSAFLRRHAGRELGERESERALTLLEMQRHALAMYTSCGWFFNDISGVEAVHVLRRAGRVVELLDRLGLKPPLEGFLEILSEAKSNVAAKGSGAEIFMRAVEHAAARPRAVSVPAHELAASGDNDEGAHAAEEAERAALARSLRAPAATNVFEDLITLTVINYAADPTTANHSAAMTVIDLARRLNPSAAVERAQEIFYEAARKGLPDADASRELAAALGLAPEFVFDGDEAVASGNEPGLSPPPVAALS